MAQLALANFPSWNNGHPLVVTANSPTIPQVAFKVLPKFDWYGKTPYEHYQDVYLLALSFDITDEMVMNILLSHSFEGKVVEWFQTFTPKSINTWGELCQALIKIFVTDGDDSTFLSLIACIKRHPHESINEFNIIFEKIWKYILVMIRPTNAQALVYYRKCFLPNLNMLIVMSGDTFLNVYQMAKTFEHTFVSYGKMQPRIIIPLFLNLSPKQAL